MPGLNLLSLIERKRIITLCFIILPFLFTSCFKEDERVAPFLGKVDTAAMTPTYKYQIFYDLGSGSNVQEVLKTDWDLGFSCDTNGIRIILNTSNFMKAAIAENGTFGAVVDTSGYVWKFDKSDGNPDSAAFLNWIHINNSDTSYLKKMFIVNRGMDDIGNLRGMRQIIFDSLKGSTYYFRFANYNGSSITSFSITKQPGLSFIGFSFASGGQVKQVEPPKTDWDIKFTQYTTLLFTDEGAAYPYLVTGVLINPYKVQVAIDSQHDFNSITFNDVQGMQFSSAEDGIGYDWKFYSFESGIYAITPNKTFIIKDTDGLFYKLRFVSFYNGSGQKGYPVFEYKLLL